MTARLYLLCASIIVVTAILTISPVLSKGLPEMSVRKDPVSGESVADNLARAGVGHRIGNIVLCINNNGLLGGYYGIQTDYFTGELIPSCEYPKGSNTWYLSGAAFWIGAVKGSDTAVSTGASDYSWHSEFFPEMAGNSPIIKRSSIESEPCYSTEAVSEEDYIAKYTDTAQVSDQWSYHEPLGIEVTQRSYAWSYDYAEDFILFDYSIRNIGFERLEKIYMGIWVDADVFWGDGGHNSGWIDDICGFVRSITYSDGGCEFEDTVNIAWNADNDGDPENSVFGERSVRNATGTRIVRTPGDEPEVSFNWWVGNFDPTYDFGPREKPFVGILQEDFRDFGTGGLGTPVGDHNKYYIMRNREFDYDQIYTATISAVDSLWLSPPHELAANWADGFDNRYLLSFGPFDIDPGERVPLSFAYVGGENLHLIPENAQNLPLHPDIYYSNLDFSDLGLNAAWAEKVYDNPGVDTDGDGWAGKVRVCCHDSLAFSLDDISDTATIDGFNSQDCEITWYKGDGVPDFSGASPPPAPDFWLLPTTGAILVRINGQKSETAVDLFSQKTDFEGYRVYMGRDERESSYSLIGSYDRENYNKHVWTGYRFEVLEEPFTLDSLRCLYGLSCDDAMFHPLMYNPDNLYIHPLYPEDSVFYFTEQDYNVSQFGVNTKIRKTYPDQPYPSSLFPDSADPGEVTEDGYLKYFEYQFLIEDLLPTIPYWINVTAFDHGSPELALSGLETSLSRGAKTGYASPSSEAVAEQGLRVYVYPNPYRGDANYRDMGFEGRTHADRPDYRVRAVNFANLPAKCVIRIYSLDGDLIREINHDVPVDDPAASHETWSLITRNTQMITTGLYYWTVEAANGKTQIGKLVIIM
ncbi:MAG: hypothetical protein JSV52_05320 [Candidatus Zixiibacteriota bacterium]|nr:MAG: hypothetical protein JSV52_05320 [candidate division Zixibacteria bacterium]